MKEKERIFKALANRRRLAIIKYLKNKRDASVGELAQAIRLSFKATSKHLSILSAAGLVDKDQRSIHIFYSLSGGMEKVSRHLIDVV